MPEKKITLKEWRWVNKLSQEQLAEKLRVSQELVSQVERGISESPLVLIQFKELYPEDYKRIIGFN